MKTAEQSPRVFNLLKLADAHNRYTNAFTQASGERFNVFEILHIGHREVTTHSPMLGELLDPRGSHGQGAAFLTRFLEQLKLEPFCAESASVKLEYYAGPRTDKEGGRLDILITDREQRQIVIENKIYAGDQGDQMARYRQFAPTAHLIYLTLDGSKPKNCRERKIRGLKCASYRGDILEWLKLCRKDAACSHNVRETLSQYIHLVEDLTHQSTTSHMNQELIKAIIGDKESLRAYYTLRDSEDSVHAALIAHLNVALDVVATSRALQRKSTLLDLRKRRGGFFFTTPGLLQRNLHICFQFDTSDFQNFFFGFGLVDPDHPSSCGKKLFSAFTQHFPSEAPSSEWPAWSWWPEYRDWGHEEFEAIRSGQFVKDLKPKLETLAKIARTVCPNP